MSDDNEDSFTDEEIATALHGLIAKQRAARVAVPSLLNDPYYLAQPFNIHAPQFEGSHVCLFYTGENPVTGLCWKPIDPEAGLPILGGGAVRLLPGPNWIPITHWAEPGFTPRGKPTALRALIDRGAITVIPPELCTRDRVLALYKQLTPDQRRDRARATSSGEDLEILIETPGLLVGQAHIDAQAKLATAGPRDVKRVGPRLPEGARK